MPDLLEFEWQKCPDGYQVVTFRPGEVEWSRQYDPSGQLSFEEHRQIRHVIGVKEDASADMRLLAEACHLWGLEELSDLAETGWPGDIYRRLDDTDVIIPKSNRMTPCNSLESGHTLFLEFAEVSDDKERVVDFCDKYGLLTRYGGPEVLGRWRYYQKDMSELVSRWQKAQRDGNYKDLVLYAGMQGNDEERSLRPTLLWQVGRDLPSLTLQPGNLLAAMFLQALQTVSLDAQLKRCVVCGKWFRFGTGTGRRSSANYCSNKCRQAAHRARKRET